MTPPQLRQSSVVRALPIVHPCDAIRWTRDNTTEVHEFIERRGWTTRYMSGAHGRAMYLHPKEHWRGSETSVHVGHWIVHSGYMALSVVEPKAFTKDYEIVGSA